MGIAERGTIVGTWVKMTDMQGKVLRDRNVIYFLNLNANGMLL